MEIPEGAEVYDTPLSKFWIGEHGILYAISKKAERNIENYKEVFELYNRLSDNGARKFCILCDITETQLITKEVRVFVATEAARFTKAMALISRSATGITAGNVFEMLSSTPYPIANFSDYHEAVKWLRQQL